MGYKMSELAIINNPLEKALDKLDEMLSKHTQELADIKAIKNFHDSLTTDPTYYYDKAAEIQHGYGRYSSSLNVIKDIEAPVKALHAHYWGSILSLTNLSSIMPAGEYSKWMEDIRQLNTPEFTRENVLATIKNVTAETPRFFASKVDGVFQALSRSHVTNQPEGFSKRMIINYITDTFGSNYKTCAIVDDLRKLIATLNNQDENLVRGATGYDVTHLMRTSQFGQWVEIDQGSLRIKLFKKGTLHIEIEPELAIRLNQQLAILYPSAIPEKNRKPKAEKKEYKTKTDITYETLSLGICDSLRSVNMGNRNQILNAPKFIWEVLTRIGGVQSERNPNSFTFNYYVLPVVRHLAMTGVIPQYKGHQFYPTPESLIDDIKDLLPEFENKPKILEPSAGTGILADLVKEHYNAVPVCIEIESLNELILRSKGYLTKKADFLKEYKNLKDFDLVVMNPPFNKGEYKEHLQAAWSTLKSKGTLVSVVPNSLSEADILKILSDLEGLDISTDYDNVFDNTSVSVKIIKAVKK